MLFALFTLVGFFIGSTVTCAAALFLTHLSEQKQQLRGLAVELSFENDMTLEDAKQYIAAHNL